MKKEKRAQQKGGRGRGKKGGRQRRPSRPGVGRHCMQASANESPASCTGETASVLGRKKKKKRQRRRIGLEPVTVIYRLIFAIGSKGGAISDGCEDDQGPNNWAMGKKKRGKTRTLAADRRPLYRAHAWLWAAYSVDSTPTGPQPRHIGRGRVLERGPKGHPHYIGNRKEKRSEKYEPDARGDTPGAVPPFIVEKKKYTRRRVDERCGQATCVSNAVFFFFSRVSTLFRCLSRRSASDGVDRKKKEGGGEGNRRAIRAGGRAKKPGINKSRLGVMPLFSCLLLPSHESRHYHPTLTTDPRLRLPLSQEQGCRVLPAIPRRATLLPPPSPAPPCRPTKAVPR